MTYTSTNIPLAPSPICIQTCIPIGQLVIPTNAVVRRESNPVVLNGHLLIPSNAVQRLESNPAALNGQLVVPSKATATIG